MFALLVLGASVSSGELYCPSAQDMNVESNAKTSETSDAPSFQDGGWFMRGGSRVSSKTAWNLLGGYMEFDMDTSKVSPGVNTNFYTTSPNQPNCGKDCYCDIQKNPNKPSCMEMDIIEANGNCKMQTTIHTFATDGKPNNANCDRWGCASQASLPGGKFHIKAEFSKNGTMTVYLNGAANDQYNPWPSAASNQVVVQTMSTIGAVIESSQWYGWAPAQKDCPDAGAGGLDNSQFAISNVRVLGTVVQGPEPTKCSNSTKF